MIVLTAHQREHRAGQKCFAGAYKVALLLLLSFQTRLLGRRGSQGKPQLCFTRIFHALRKLPFTIRKYRLDGIHLKAKIHGLLSTYPIIFRTQTVNTHRKNIQVFKRTVIYVDFYCQLLPLRARHSILCRGGQGNEALSLARAEHRPSRLRACE